MRIQVNNREVVIPSSLSEFTLGQRIAFFEQHGRELDEMVSSIVAMPEGTDRDLEIAQLQFEKMIRTFAFFAGVSVEAVKETEYLDDIARIYHASLATLVEDEQKLEPQYTFTWKGEEWELQPPALSNGSKMTFGEFIDSKQLIKDMIEIGKGKWEYMLPICAIYLRKKGEAYSEEFLYEGSERLELMKQLPMDIALQVGFFLTSSMNIYLNTLQSSSLPGSKDQVSTALSTITGGAGSTS